MRLRSRSPPRQDFRSGSFTRSMSPSWDQRSREPASNSSMRVGAPLRRSDPIAARIEQASATVDVPAEGPISLDAQPTEPDPMVVKIQAGLKAFGNDTMEIDGRIGSKTRAAIKEFQSLFGLKVTGEPSDEVYAKMREIGLTN